MQKSKKYSFHADNLDSSILISCPITGICSRIEMPTLPIVMQFNHPISEWQNALQCVIEINKKKNHKDFPIQVLSGIVLSLLREKGKLNQFPNSSASEANMLLQSAGLDIVWELLDIIRSKWDSETTWQRVPKLSFNLQAYNNPEANFSEVITRYSRLIRKALTLEELSKSDIGEVFLAFKENSKKLSKERPNGIHIKSIESIRHETIQSQNRNAKTLCKSLSKDMPTILAIQTKKVCDQLELFGQDYRNDLATKIRLIGIGHSKQDDFKQLAFLIENVESSFLDEDIIGFSDSISPMPIPTKSASQIIAERLAKLSQSK